MSLLAACAAEPPKPPPKVVEVIPEAPSLPHPRIPRPAHKPEPPASAAEPDQGENNPTLAMAAPTTQPPPQPSELIGLDEAGTSRLFGKATEEAAEPPAQVWRYKAGSCELDLFFYYDLKSGRMRTLRYSFKGDAADKDRQQECLKSLAAAGRV